MTPGSADLTLILAHVAQLEPTVADKAREASAVAVTSAGVPPEHAREWCEDFEEAYAEGVTSTRTALADLLAHPLAAMFPTLALELFLGGMSADDVLAELREVV